MQNNEFRIKFSINLQYYLDSKILNSALSILD